MLSILANLPLFKNIQNFLSTRSFIQQMKLYKFQVTYVYMQKTFNLINFLVELVVFDLKKKPEDW